MLDEKEGSFYYVKVSGPVASFKSIEFDLHFGIRELEIEKLGKLIL